LTLTPSTRKQSTALGNGDGAKRERQTLEFDDNRLLLPLFGEHDQHLALIEDRAGVEIAPRGNHVVIKGEAHACRQAKAALKSLYGRLQEGLEVDPGEVEGALRMAARGDDNGGGQRFKTRKRTISARSPQQQAYIDALATKSLVFGTGPAGTGKTYLAVAAAAAALDQGKVERIILSRPAVEAGERLGFLPGDMRDKVDPYLRPLYDALYDLIPGDLVTRGLETGVIEIAPLAFMRGRTLAHAFIILDEAQNCTPMQMKMFLTRLGESSSMAVTGDPSQTDLPPGTVSGLAEAVALLGRIDDVAHVAFTDKDVMRSTLVTEIVRAYDAKDERAKRAARGKPAPASPKR